MPPTVFGDTFYWLALARPRDPWHAAALAWAAANPTARVATTDEVLTEFLNVLSGAGQAARNYAAATVRDIHADSQMLVLPQTRNDFDAALTMYEARSDKGYSLTDCRSMNAMRDLGISDVLTNDHHFTQEGFSILFPGP